MDPDERSTQNMGWYYLSALRGVNHRGRWPNNVTPRERTTLRSLGLVEIIHMGRRMGRRPRLTGLGEKILNGLT